MRYEVYRDSLPETTVGTTDASTDFGTSILTGTSVTLARAAAGGGTLGVGSKPNVNDDCPPEGANTRDVVRLFCFGRDEYFCYEISR